jgi:hypothetical protein
MIPKVKLRKSIILHGAVYNRDKKIRRSLLEGTRFDDPEFVIEPDDPEYNEPAWDSLQEISSEVIEQSGGPTEEEIVRIPGVKRPTFTKRRR